MQDPLITSRYNTCGVRSLTFYAKGATLAIIADATVGRRPKPRFRVDHADQYGLSETSRTVRVRRPAFSTSVGRTLAVPGIDEHPWPESRLYWFLAMTLER